ncbi:hypothetical protein [Haloglomus salinum]|uniref:hypothetical protein n=1 Tax=Haloglomus salinum TaxID=2962673 RepID=UPI0020C9FE3F|nr:hypothetical protein [Haloglomus salinum]
MGAFAPPLGGTGDFDSPRQQNFSPTGDGDGSGGSADETTDETTEADDRPDE